MMRRRIHLAWLAAVLICAGCNSSDPDTQNTDAQRGKYAHLTGQEVLQQMTDAYRSADSYSDRAVLYLTYRLQGKPNQEPQPWAVAYEKAGGKFNAQFYDTNLSYDGEQLGCRVFDIQSENLDNQYLMIRGIGIPLDRLMKDALARRFVGGFAELPLDDRPEALVDSMLPPTIRLLAGQGGFPWLDQTHSIQRLDDQTVEGVVCFHVQTVFKGEPCEFWIEQETGLIHQLLFPNAVLEPHVFDSNQVTNLKLVARFHDCQFGKPIEKKVFQVNPPADASLVTEFVKLPEVFPSELIGRRAPQFAFQTPYGKEIQSKSFSGKPTALLWIAGFAAEDGIGKLDSIYKQMGSSANLGIVYSNAVMKDPSGATYELVSELEAYVRDKGIRVPFYCDHHLDVGSKMRIKAIPSVVVLDANLKIQFARSLSEKNWETELSATLIRVGEGHDIAQEMIDDYGKYYTQYREKLRQVSVRGTQQLPAQSVSAPVKSRGMTRQLWSANLLQPGSVSAISINEQIQVAVLDGYRTVAVVDDSGKLIARKELDLPANQGVTRIRMIPHQGRRVLAAFSKLGSQVHWFDEQLNRLGSFPENPNSAQQIADCQWNIASDRSLSLVVSVKGQGVFQVGLNGASEKMAIPFVDELSTANGVVSGVSQGRLVSSRQPNFNAGVFDGWFFSRLQCMNQSPETYCGIGATDDGKWKAIGLDKNLAIQWKAEIGSQEFSGDMEPLCYSPIHNAWVVANSDYGFTVLSAQGNAVHIARVDEGIRGICILPDRRKLKIVYAEASKVRCVEIDIEM